MSQMPTLFDDEEYFIPQPQKEVKKNTPKKGKKATEPEAAAEPDGAAVSEAEAAVTDDIIETQPEPVVEAPAVMEAEVAEEESTDAAVAETIVEETIVPEISEAILQDTEPVAEEPVTAIQEEEIAAEEIIAIEDEIYAEEPEATATINEEEDTITEAIEEEEIIAIEEADEIAAEAVSEIEEAPVMEEIAEETIVQDLPAATEMTSETFETEDDIEAATDEEAEAIELAESTEATETITEQIAFEIPEADNEITEQEISIAPIKEEPVDNLDKLMFTEMIALDYTAYAGLSFEPGTTAGKPVAEQSATEEEAVPDQGQAEETIVAQEEEQSWEENLETAPEAEEKPTALPEFNLENKYYTIGEVAQMFGVNVSHIRFWTTEFSLKVRTTRKGDRLYNPENIGKLRLIHHLVKENKHTIKGAKEQLKARKQAINAQVDLKDKLSSLKAQLERIKRNL